MTYEVTLAKCWAERWAGVCRLSRGIKKTSILVIDACTVCPTRYRTGNFFNNSNTNKDTATKFEQEYVLCVTNEDECVCSVCVCSVCVCSVCVCSVCVCL